MRVAQTRWALHAACSQFAATGAYQKDLSTVLTTALLYVALALLASPACSTALRRQHALRVLKRNACTAVACIVGMKTCGVDGQLFRAGDVLFGAVVTAACVARR